MPITRLIRIKQNGKFEQFFIEFMCLPDINCLKPDCMLSEFNKHTYSIQQDIYYWIFLI